MEQIIIKDKNTGQLTVRRPYYNMESIGTPLNHLQQPIKFRDSNSFVCYKNYKQLVYKPVTIYHNLTNIANVSGYVLASDSKSFTVPSNIKINGVDVLKGDLIDLPANTASSMKIIAGIWIATTPTLITLLNPPTYNIGSAYHFGYPWRFQPVDGEAGAYEGLVQVDLANRSHTNVSSIDVPNKDVMYQHRTSRGSYTNFTNLSSQGVTTNFDDVFNVRRLELMVSSVRSSGDRSYPSASFNIGNGNNTSYSYLFINANTDRRQSNGFTYWATGQVEWFYTDVFNKTFTQIRITDSANSRAAIHTLGFLKPGACRFWCDEGLYPPNGSIIHIPDSVADDMRPKIPAGDYDVITNDNTAQWKIKKRP